MLFYITFVNLSSTSYAGVRKKVMAQSKALENKLGITYYTLWNYEIAYLMHGEEEIEKVVAATRKDYIKTLINWMQSYKVKQTYIRYPLAHKFFIDFLKHQKDNGIKTVLEIPTYPYDAELSNGRLKMEDGYYREKVGEYVEIISTYSEDINIWGKPCIKLVNGIDVDAYKVSGKKIKENELVMVAAAGAFMYWNGFERVIEGLNIYQKEVPAYKIKFILLGKDGDENYYKKLVRQYDLEDVVIFADWLTGGELDNVFEQADIAISSLGFYKKGIDIACPIKGGEYCARGLPIVCGYKDIRFVDNPFFIMQVSNDNSTININEIIKFYEDIRRRDHYKEQIRDYAKNNLTWDVIMQPIIDYLK